MDFFSGRKLGEVNIRAGWKFKKETHFVKADKIIQAKFKKGALIFLRWYYLLKAFLENWISKFSAHPGKHASFKVDVSLEQ